MFALAIFAHPFMKENNKRRKTMEINVKGGFIVTGAIVLAGYTLYLKGKAAAYKELYKKEKRRNKDHDNSKD